MNNSSAVDFSFIRYANCWEDADLLISNTLPIAGERILSIAAAGDNSLSFLAYDPAQVLAFDINETQLFLTELKQQAIKHLEYEDVLAFLGFNESAKRETYFKNIGPHMSAAARNYFTQRPELIKHGIIHQGKFENYFRIFRRYILPLIHTQHRIDKLFEGRDATAQHAFYDHEWNNSRWRLLFKVFFSRFVMGKLGRDPKFFKEAKEPVAQKIFKRAEAHLQSAGVSGNYFLDYQLRGSFSVNLPYYMRPENFGKIKQNIDALELYKGYLTDVPVNQHFDIMNLSNIFEYMNWELFVKQADFLSKITGNNTRLAYWNLLVERKLSKASAFFKETRIQGKDLCFFYDSFELSRISSWQS